MQKLYQIMIVGVVVAANVAVGEEFAPGTEQAYERTVLPFFKQHCMSCHNEATAKAGLNLEKLDAAFGTGPSAKWIEVMDAINLGEMPPKDEPRPDPARSFEVVKWIAEQLTHAEKVASAAGGQIPMRRLNRDEYANTVRDLLQIDEKVLGPILEDLPGDGKAEGFDRLGVALFFDKTQLERTMAAAEQIAELAIVRPEDRRACRHAEACGFRYVGIGTQRADEQALDPQMGGLDYQCYQRFMFDVITLALQTDSTRVVSYQPRMDLSTGAWRASHGNPYGYHTITHHGEDADKLKWLTRSDILYMGEWAYFLNKLKSVLEGDGTLLDHTMAVYSSTRGTSRPQ